jgi:hypothetical protein
MEKRTLRVIVSIVGHDRCSLFAFHSTGLPIMITSKSTRAEILAAYQALKAQQEAQTITWPLLINTGKIIFREAVALIDDLQKAGAFARQWISETYCILSQPVLR